LVLTSLPIDEKRLGICGHSMGGHGALSLYLKHPSLFNSVSAFSPICSPTRCPWGEKAFTAYFGDEKAEWEKHDSSLLMRGSEENFKSIKRSEILIDQGGADEFLEDQLKPELFKESCQEVGHPLRLRIPEGYDHSYYFIQSFIEDHLKHHAALLS